MTYEKLLLTKEWQTKSSQIKSRDQNKCQNCNNLQLLKTFNWENFSITLGNGVWANISQEQEGTKKNISSKISVETAKMLGNFKFREEGKICFVLYDQKSLNDEYFRIIGFFKVNSEFEDSSELLSRLDEIEWSQLKNLHTHHTYYQDGLNPWEYPDDSLVTLCWACHENLHNDTVVPWLDVSGTQKGVLTPCKRCAGAGIFPEFFHIENGICFRCGGYRYEEFMKDVLN